MAPDERDGSSGHGQKLSRKQEAVIVALLTEPNHRAAATAAGIGYSTLRRWLQNAQFAEAYRAAKTELLTSATTHLRRIATTGARTLELVANDQRASPAARVSASRAIIELALRAHEIEELEGRIAALEMEREDDEP